jgi:hypothetical protein
MTWVEVGLSDFLFGAFSALFGSKEVSMAFLGDPRRDALNQLVASSRCSKQNIRIKKPRGEAGLKYD